MADTIQKIITTTFQLKRGTADQWTNLQPILKIGEPGFETDTGKLKIGDGSTAWPNLPYFLHENTVLIPADQNNNTPAFTQKNLIETIADATEGSVLTKQNGALTWTAPIQETDLADIIANSSDVHNTIKEKISQELADATVLRFKGEAVSAEVAINEVIPTLYDSNMDEILGQDGDVYLYQGIEYVYDSAQNGWIELGASEKFNTTDDLVTQDEFLTLQEIVSGIKNKVQALETKTEKATNNDLGVVKGSLSQDKIAINNDGSMSINTIGIDKLVNVEGIELILDGGNANNLDIGSEEETDFNYG